jgi:hypothetical protein
VADLKHRSKSACADALASWAEARPLQKPQSEEKAAGLSGCCPDQAADSALRCRSDYNWGFCR